jgi:signal transduction histidine kinase
MIKDLWSFLEITSEPEPLVSVELTELVSGVLESLEAIIEAKKIRLSVGRLPQLWGRPKQLEHVMANLLGNAVKYMPPTGGDIELSGGVQDGFAFFCVRDNGIGIAEEFHQRIFELFGQVPRQEGGHDGDTRGTGVGLAIVKRIVEEHGGAVWVESALNSGSRFWVRLPLPQNPAPEGQP